MTAVPVDKVRAGTVYHVSWDDCCVAGEFTAAVAAVEDDGDAPDPFIEAVVFGNGVRLTSFTAVTFEEASQP